MLLNTPEVPGAEFVFPTIPFFYTSAIRHKILSLLKLNQLKEDIDHLLFELIVDFYALSENAQQKMRQIQAVKKATKEEIYKRIITAIEIMNDSVHEKKSLDVIAEAVCMNKFHFLTQFKCITGTTPHQYFTQLKLHKAHELLKSNHYTVSEVCYALNFESLGSFSTLFKRKFQRTPSEIPNFQ
jgi:AraC-like DNA-binding protein